MKSSCFKYVITPLIIIAVLATILYSFQRWQRRHLFCDVLKTDMSQKEVLLTINRYGEFKTFQFDNGENSTTVLVEPWHDFGTSLRYGMGELELGFYNDHLAGVIERYKLEDGIYDLCK